jgi:outer membrane lipoprotein carrier protein
MKIIKLILSSSVLLTLIASGQNDKKSTGILDKFSATALGAPSVSMKFDLITSDKSENRSDTISGSIIISNNKYELDLPDNIIWFNGETSWSYLTAEKEVTITKPGKKDDSFQSRPSAIFTMYKKGYKNRLIEEKSDSYIIDLYPQDIKSELIRIRLSISKSVMSLKSLEYKKRDGQVITVSVKDYNLKFKPDPSFFTFSPDKYKGVDVIDMR